MTRAREDLVEARRQRPAGRTDGPRLPPGPERLASLQRSAGNRAVTGLLAEHAVQRQAGAAPLPVIQRVTLGIDYIVSGHGWDRINERGISQIQLEKTLDNPTVVHDGGNKWIYVSAFAGGKVCIRAVMSKDLPMTVITVMKITGAKKVKRYVDRP